MQTVCGVFTQHWQRFNFTLQWYRSGWTQKIWFPVLSDGKKIFKKNLSLQIKLLIFEMHFLFFSFLHFLFLLYCSFYSHSSSVPEGTTQWCLYLNVLCLWCLNLVAAHVNRPLIELVSSINVALRPTSGAFISFYRSLRPKEPFIFSIDVRIKRRRRLSTAAVDTNADLGSRYVMVVGGSKTDQTQTVGSCLHSRNIKKKRRKAVLINV